MICSGTQNTQRSPTTTTRTHYSAYCTDTPVDSTYEYPTEKKWMILDSSRGAWDNGENFSNFRFDAFDICATRKANKHSYVEPESQRYEQPSLRRQLSGWSNNLTPVMGFTHMGTFKRPQPFMGAFVQTQFDFKCFDLNIKIPSPIEVKPFERILSLGEPHEKIITESVYKPSSYNAEHSVFGSNSSFGEEVKSVDLCSMDQNLAISDIREIDYQNMEEDNPNQSFFSNYDQLIFNKQKSQVNQSILWEQDEPATRIRYAYQMHSSLNQPFLQEVQKLTTLSNGLPIRYMHWEQICSCIIKMLQGIQSQLFLLDYAKLEWSFIGASSLRLENHLRHSLAMHLSDILVMANFKSRLEAALAYIKKQKVRRIFQEVGDTVKEILLIVEGVALEIQARKGTMLDFVFTLSEFSPEIHLLYDLMINQRTVAEIAEKTFMDFDYTFLNSEAIIFKQILRLSSDNDSQIGRIHELVLKLLRAAFKPITFTLNRIVFQETMQISNYDETYLRYYFESMKDILTFLGKKISLIKQESNELYLICRIRNEIKVIVEIDQLKEYDAKWREIFKEKKRMVEEVYKREKRRAKEQKQKKQEKKMKEIYELKERLYKSIQESKKRKSLIYEQSVIEINRLKKEIAQREETRRLNYLIEKEEEKGFLLDLQLKEKMKLIKQKEILLDQAEKKGIDALPKQKVQEEQIELKKVQNNSQQIKQPEIALISPPSNSVELKIENQRAQLNQKQAGEVKEDIVVEEEAPNEVESERQVSESSQNNGLMKRVSLQIQALPSKNEDSSNEDREDQIHVSTNTVLQNCIDNIIRQQIDLTDMAMSYLVYERYQLPVLMDFLRKVFLTSNGQIVSEFLSASMNGDSVINLNHFHQCIMFDYCDQSVRLLEPEFYEMGIVGFKQDMGEGFMSIYRNKKMNIFHQNLEMQIGFQFRKVPVMLESYFSYIHLSKYMQIFSFIFKIRHSTSLLSAALLQLNQCKCQLLRGSVPEKRLLQKLYNTRYIAQSFLITLQNFLYYRVIEKEVKIMKAKLKAKELNQLAAAHLKMLDTIIKTGLVDNPHADISKKIKALLLRVREFKNIVDMFCVNDVPSYIRQDVESQVDRMFKQFRNEQFFLERLFYHP